MAESQKTEHDVIMELFNDYGSLIPNIELKAGMAKEIVRRLRFNGMIDDPEAITQVTVKNGMFVAEDTEEPDAPTDLNPDEFGAIPADTIAAVNKVRKRAATEDVTKTSTKKSTTKKSKASRKTTKGSGEWIGE